MAPLRISVSKVAATCGYHPYCSREDFRELFETAVWDDPDVFSVDSSALGARPSTQELDVEASLNTLARSNVAGERALAALAANILEQRQSTQSVRAVEKLAAQSKAVSKAAVDAGALGARQAQQLDCALRSAVNTSFGTRHEDDAIKLYERQTGCEVRESNEELLLDYGFAFLDNPHDTYSLTLDVVLGPDAR